MTSSNDGNERSLVYLAALPVDMVKGIGPKNLKKLTSHGIRSVADLLLTPPRRYLDRSQLFDIASAPIGEEVTIGGVVTAFSKRRISRGRTMVEAKVSDGTRTVRVVWFNPYIKLDEGEEVALSGTLETFGTTLQMKGPDVDRLSREPALTTGRVVPVYSTISGINAATLRSSIDNAVRRAIPVRDVLDEATLDAYDLVDRSFAIERIHFPEALSDVDPARRRLVFDEFLRIQMALRVRAYDEFETQVGVSNSVRGPLLERYIGSLPFELTPDQGKALSEILHDMEAGTPLHRLLQGEVGSGKTVVVIAALLTSVESGHQAAFMAPTEVLATQHYLGTIRSLAEAGMAPVADADLRTGTASLFGSEPPATRPVRVALFTSGRVLVNFSRSEVNRTRALEWLADGTIDIAFGTHALIQPDVSFHSLGITVVDEQHRFGVEQRVHLRDSDRRDGVPDLLLMTATPIPRTFVMALYGDLEVSTIVTMPPGRTELETAAINADAEADTAVDSQIRSVVASGNQVFVVCPLVEPSDKIDARSATEEYLRVAGSLRDLRVGLLHGQMTSSDKAEVMEAFRVGAIDVLIATTVIEVGIDVPNATLIVVWNAERFGLSQLHQLRGRVGRGSHPGRCLLVVDASTPDAERRVDAMVATTDGFELAEVDLRIRGHGTIFGSSQSGAGDLRFGDLLRDGDLVIAASECATRAVAEDRTGRLVLEVLEEFRIFIGESDEWLGKS